MALVLQLRSIDLVGLIDGDPVDVWPNAQGVTVQQATVAQRPIFRTNVLGAYPGVRFDAVDDRMSTTLAIAGQPYTIFVVYAPDFAGSAARRLIQGTNNWLMGPYSGTINVYNGAFIAGPTVINGRYAIQSIVVSGTGTLHRVSGWAAGGNANTLGPATIGLGAQGAFAEPANSTLIELRVYNHAMTDVERDAVIEDLSSTYGITALFTGPTPENHCHDFQDDPVASGIPADWAEDVPNTSSTTWNVYDEAGVKMVKRDGTAAATLHRLRYVPAGGGTDQEILARMRRDAGSDIAVILRDNGPIVNGIAVTVSTGGGGLLTIKQSTMGNWINAFTSPFVTVNGQWFWIRGRTIGARIQAKAWLDGDPEPALWMIDQLLGGGWPTEGAVSIGDFEVASRFSCSHFSVATGGLTAEDVCTIPPPTQPSLTADVTCGETELVGSAYVGDAPFLESVLTIRRVADQVVVDTVTAAVTSWTYLPTELPYDVPLEASIVYRDTAGGESLPSDWEPFTVLEPVVLSGLIVENPSDGGTVFAEVIDVSWNEPSYVGTPEVGAIFEYHGEIDRFEGAGYVPLFVGLGTRSFPLDLTAYAGRQFKIRVSAVLGECGFTQTETTFEILATPVALYNQIECPDVMEATEILEGEIVAFTDVECPDTMVLTSEDDC